MAKESYADEVLDLTLEDIEKCRDLIRQRNLKVQSQPVNADELKDKLCRLPSRDPSPSRSTTSSARTSVWDPEETKEEDLSAEKGAHDALVADGGRPSHPISLGFDVLDHPAEYKDILWFWHFNGGYQREFHNQLAVWRKFRGYQARVREYYVKRDRFHEYQQKIRESQEDKQCPWHLAVHEDPLQQNRLEDWNEFRALYYRKLKASKKRIEPAERRLLSEQKELQDAEARLPDAILDNQVLFARVEEVVASERKIAEAKSRYALAEQTIQTIKSDKLQRIDKKVALLKAAQEELCLAKTDLDDVSESDEIRRLREGYELIGCHSGVIFARKELGSAHLHVKRWETFLKWIDSQYSAIAAECGSPTGSTVQGIPISPHQHIQGEDGITGRTPRRALQQRRGTSSHSVLGVHPSSKISKKGKKKSIRCPKMLLPPGETLPKAAPQGAVTDCMPHQSERIRRSSTRRSINCPEMGSLRPIHSSKVTKATRPAKITKSVRPAHPPRRSTRTESPVIELGLGRCSRSAESWTRGSVDSTANLRRSKRIMAQRDREFVKTV